MKASRTRQSRSWSPRKVAVASMVGTTIEYYDFFIYGTAAALVLGKQFFPNASPVVGTLASFATFGVGFIARPLGGVVMGHFGDRIGRKSMLMLALGIMGTATVLIGLLPNYGAIGLAAPILLVILRFAQGFGIGGEVGGAILMSFEHAPRGRRALYGSFPLMGLPFGVLLSTLVFIVVQALVGAESFNNWGWRIPFLLTIVIVIVGMLIRSKTAETPEFKAAKAEGEVRKMPVVQVVRVAPKELITGSLALVAAPTLGYLLLVYLISYGTSVLGLPPSTMLWLIVLGVLVWLIATPFAGMLGDRLGRKRLFVAGTVWVAVWAFPFFALLNTRSFPLMLIGMVVAMASIAPINGVQGALVSEAFPTYLRYSGISIVMSVAALLGGAIAPLLATALFAATGSSDSVALYMVAVSVLSLVGVFLLNSSPDRYDPTPHVADLPSIRPDPATDSA